MSFERIVVLTAKSRGFAPCANQKSVKIIRRRWQRPSSYTRGEGRSIMALPGETQRAIKFTGAWTVFYHVFVWL